MAATAIVAAIGWFALYSGCMTPPVTGASAGACGGFGWRAGPPTLATRREEARLVNGGRSAVVQANGKTVKVTVRGRSSRVPADAVTRLAAIVADRLAERSEVV